MILTGSRVIVGDGKYDVLNENGKMTFLRHGETWLTGQKLYEHSGLVLALVQEIQELREKYFKHALPTEVSLLPWRPIAELDTNTRYGDENGFLLMAPELEDADCNVHGVGMGYFNEETWTACKWSMVNDEWTEAVCTPTHYLRLTGAW